MVTNKWLPVLGTLLFSMVNNPGQSLQRLKQWWTKIKLTTSCLQMFLTLVWFKLVTGWLPISLILVLTMDNYSMNITRLSPFLASTPLEKFLLTLQWRHNGLDDVSNHQPHHCLLVHLFGRRSKKTSKLRVTGLYAGNSPGTGELPAQMASNGENVSIWWHHHDKYQRPTFP